MLKAKDFRKEAWGKLKSNWGILILAMIIYNVIVGACGALSLYGGSFA